MGRSRGGLTTKIHALVDAEGRPIHLLLTAGQAGSATRSAAEQQAQAQAKALAERYRLARAFIGLAANQLHIGKTALYDKMKQRGILPKVLRKPD